MGGVARQGERKQSSDPARARAALYDGDAAMAMVVPLKLLPTCPLYALFNKLVQCHQFCLWSFGFLWLWLWSWVQFFHSFNWNLPPPTTLETDWLTALPLPLLLIFLLTSFLYCLFWVLTFSLNFFGFYFGANKTFWVFAAINRGRSAGGCKGNGNGGNYTN